MTAAIHKVNSPEHIALVHLSQASSGHGNCGTSWTRLNKCNNGI
jgi:hypothetical protein